jgi:hypothetical protein
MIRAALVLLALSAAPVAAQEIHAETTPEGVTLHYHNHGTDRTGTEARTIPTAIGPVGVTLNHTWNGACVPPCPDLIEIVSLPDGYVAVPSSIEIPEGSDTDIRIFIYFGG